jgi:hypothetical protein
MVCANPHRPALDGPWSLNIPGALVTGLVPATSLGACSVFNSRGRRDKPATTRVMV